MRSCLAGLAGRVITGINMEIGIYTFAERTPDASGLSHYSKEGCTS
jgi:hypothetical protein